MASGSDLFGEAPSMPAGFAYEPSFLTSAEERELVARVADLPFSPFQFQGYTANRRVISFGWAYDFQTQDLRSADEIPSFLSELRTRSAAFAGLDPAELQHVLLTEYAAEAGIGWHRDKGVFGKLVGIPLLSSCLFRFRRRRGTGWERFSVLTEPRSAYLLKGAARTEWEHSIPSVDALRYSITFRTLKAG